MLEDRYAARMEWKEIITAPFDGDLELAVENTDGMLALVFPCRRAHAARTSWLHAVTGRPVEVHPTHWREWRS